MCSAATGVRNGGRGRSKPRKAAAMFDPFNVQVVSLVLVGLAIVAVFYYIPFVSEYAFWFAVAGYVMLAGHRPAKK